MNFEEMNDLVRQIVEEENHGSVGLGRGKRDSRLFESIMSGFDEGNKLADLAGMHESENFSDAETAVFFRDKGAAMAFFSHALELGLAEGEVTFDQTVESKYGLGQYAVRFAPHVKAHKRPVMEKLHQDMDAVAMGITMPRFYEWAMGVPGMADVTEDALKDRLALAKKARAEIKAQMQSTRINPSTDPDVYVVQSDPVNESLVEEDLSEAVKGKAQEAIMKYLKGANGPVQLTDMVRHKDFRGMNFGKVQKAAEALEKKGMISMKSKKGEGDLLSLKEDEEFDVIWEADSPKIRAKMMDKGYKFMVVMPDGMDPLYVKSEKHAQKVIKDFSKEYKKAKFDVISLGEEDIGRSEKKVTLIFSSKEKAMAFKKTVPSSVRGKMSVRKTKGWKTYSLIFSPHSYADTVELMKLYKPEKPHFKDIAKDVSESEEDIEEANPYHDDATGKFSDGTKTIKGGSWSMSDEKYKLKGKSKLGSSRKRKAKRPCGREARAMGKDVKCSEDLDALRRSVRDIIGD